MDRHHTTRDRRTHDVVVVGGRCGGAATAMLLARQGLDVVLVDRAEFPSDALSTHAIARGGVVQLSRWGLLDQVLESGAPPVRTVTFAFAGGEQRRAVKDRAGVDLLVAPRRHVLDLILLEAARTAGATIRTGLAVTGTFTDRTGRVAGVRLRDRAGRYGQIRARFVVGADGVRSRVARSVAPRVIDDRGPGGATSYAYVAGLDAVGFEFHLAPGHFAGLFPTHHGEANVWVCTPSGLGAEPDGPAAFVDLLERASPALADRVRSASVVSPVRKAAGLPNHVLAPAGPGWALVGDAGYHRDPITGHGITDAFRDAELLARRLGDVLLGGAPEDVAMAAYADERYRALVPIFDVTCRLGEFPPADEFVDLQKMLSALLDAEASWLAGLPPLATRAPASATRGDRRPEQGMRQPAEKAERAEWITLRSGGGRRRMARRAGRGRLRAGGAAIGRRSRRVAG